MDLPSSVCRPLYPLTHVIGYRPPLPSNLPISVDPTLLEKVSTPPPLTRWGRFRTHRFSVLAGNLLQTFLGCFTAIVLLALISRSRTYTAVSAPVVIGSFGAVAVLLYAAPAAPFSQPKNVLIGNVCSAIIGVGIGKAFGVSFDYRDNWAPAGLSVALSVFFMQVTDTIHPPAGAAAVLATTSHDILDLSWFFAADVTICSLLLIAWACLINNLGSRRYPLYWTSVALIREEHKVAVVAK